MQSEFWLLGVFIFVYENLTLFFHWFFFFDNVNFLFKKKYSYCANHQRASDLIREHSNGKSGKSAEFAAWLADAHKAPELHLRQVEFFFLFEKKIE